MKKGHKIERSEGAGVCYARVTPISAHNQSNTALKYIQCPFIFLQWEK